MSYIIMINFIRNTSCLPYYLWVYFLLRYYWPYRIQFLSTFISSFHFYDLNYDFISEIGIIVIILSPVVNPIHSVLVSFSFSSMALYHCLCGFLFCLLVFNFFHLADECDYLFLSHILSEVLFSVTIILLYIIISFMTLIGKIARCNIIQNIYPIEMVPYHHFYGLLLLFVVLFASSSQMSVTTRFDRRFHQK